jgi:hypothetical protein
LPLADLHRFEHVEQAMGLNNLSHRHPADEETRTPVPVDGEDAPIPGVLQGGCATRPSTEGAEPPGRRRAL